MAAPADLTLASTVKLSSGYEMPRLGFGVYQNYDTTASTLEAFAAGYRCAQRALAFPGRRYSREAQARRLGAGVPQRGGRRRRRARVGDPACGAVHQCVLHHAACSAPIDPMPICVICSDEVRLQHARLRLDYSQRRRLARADAVRCAAPSPSSIYNIRHCHTHGQRSHSQSESHIHTQIFTLILSGCPINAINVHLRTFIKYTHN